MAAYTNLLSNTQKTSSVQGLIIFAKLSNYSFNSVSYYMTPAISVWYCWLRSAQSTGPAIGQRCQFKKFTKVELSVIPIEWIENPNNINSPKGNTQTKPADNLKDTTLSWKKIHGVWKFIFHVFSVGFIAASDILSQPLLDLDRIEVILYWMPFKCQSWSKCVLYLLMSGCRVSLLWLWHQCVLETGFYMCFVRFRAPLSKHWFLYWSFLS